VEVSKVIYKLLAIFIYQILSPSQLWKVKTAIDRSSKYLVLTYSLKSKFLRNNCLFHLTQFDRLLTVDIFQCVKKIENQFVYLKCGDKILKPKMEILPAGGNLHFYLFCMSLVEYYLLLGI